MQGVDIYKDTPTEPLHTVLLGAIKYFWGQVAFVLEKQKQLDILEARLGSLSVSGLDMRPIPAHFICHLRGSLIGKHFKTLAQVLAFACYNLISSDLLIVWLLLGRLTSLLWQTEIIELDCYLAELQGVIDDLLRAVTRCSPSIIVLKPKLHFLVHLPQFIKRFGPAIIFSTE
ncbi:hypothetical protein FRC09_015622 [Ceratobasidium sp. 395]|nr:hypothetical protein FRC09_015622 [Ceratobasidium sp. 395]